jgi:hypothetical protein
MKRSKILLASTTAILAVAGVFAAKVHKFSQFKNGFYSKGGHGVTTPIVCTVATAIKYYTAPAAGASVQAFTQYSNTACAGEALWSPGAHN